jgi:hypothetical protein
MKVKTDVKAGGGCGGGLLGITAVVVVDINLFGGCQSSCGGHKGCS